ncbi:MFS transporter [Parahaliea mediterranea]|uniref:MFS transporter n=1 Tax=Parahaliea mediterranea TaxID=651086 RepID=UPI000E2EC529|nr:MFS transporter [Parahaliea mediterranea]
MNAEHQSLNLSRLFLIGNLSIFMIGLGFAVRANIAGDLQRDIFDVLDVANSAAMVGEALGITFTGFALTLLFGSALVDLVGMRVMLLLSATGYILGSALVLAAAWLPVSADSYWLVLAGLLLTGLGWGAVEAASNPLIATLYPREKTHRLNILHAWWPAGIVVGGLAGVGLAALGLTWQLNLLLLIVPGLVMLVLVLGTEFPVTERVASGVSYAEMFGELKRQPMFFLWLACMFMTAAAELAPGQWVDLALSRVVGMDGILLLVYISALMFVMRHFAGPIVVRISSIGLLWLSSVLAVIGLYGLARADSPVSAFVAATVWGVGVCYLWPTMLGSVAERFPRGGALFLGLTGFCGGMAIQFVLPQLGAIFDRAKLEAAGGAERLATLSGEELDAVLRYASVESFSAVALIPLALIPVFAFIGWRDRRQAAPR